mmetsp:Transcript_106202/g.342608  ORF Transcript_106202/g.342608 Transcript_106202/m.342608 type:complete len:300 (+) Transcript_106202:646-1545(+)
MHEGSLFGDEDLDYPGDGGLLEKELGQAVRPTLVGALGNAHEYRLMVGDEDVPTLDVHFWVVRQSVEDVDVTKAGVKPEDSPQQPGLHLPDGEEGPRDHDPAPRHAEDGVAHEEEVHERRIVKLQRPSGETCDKVVHMEVLYAHAVDQLRTPDSLEQLPLHFLTLLADLREEVAHVHDLRATRAEEAREGAVLSLEVNAVEALVHLHGVQRPRHHGVHLQARLVHHYQLEPAPLTVHGADGLLCDHHRFLDVSVEQLSDHTTNGSTAQALDSRHRGCNNAVHARLKDAAMGRLQRLPTC